MIGGVVGRDSLGVGGLGFGFGWVRWGIIFILCRSDLEHPTQCHNSGDRSVCRAHPIMDFLTTRWPPSDMDRGPQASTERIAGVSPYFGAFIIRRKEGYAKR